MLVVPLPCLVRKIEVEERKGRDGGRVTWCASVCLTPASGGDVAFAGFWLVNMYSYHGQFQGANLKSLKEELVRLWQAVGVRSSTPLGSSPNHLCIYGRDGYSLIWCKIHNLLGPPILLSVILEFFKQSLFPNTFQISIPQFSKNVFHFILAFIWIVLKFLSKITSMFILIMYTFSEKRV